MEFLSIFSKLSPAGLLVLDIVLYGAHLLLIGFNLLGWIWRSARPWHLLCVAVTAFSWLVLGFWYGFGYCVITDWQWQVKEHLGQTNLPASFIDHFVNQVLGLSVNPGLIDMLTGGLFVLVSILSVSLYIRDRRKKRD